MSAPNLEELIGIAVRAALDAASGSSKAAPAIAGTGDHETGIVRDGGLPIEEVPMYSWIAPKPYAHHARWKVWTKTIDGARHFETFDTEGEARAFIEGAQRMLVREGRPIEQLIESYLADRAKHLKASSVSTLRYRLFSIAEGRRRLPIECFPWQAAWRQHIEPQSGDSQRGILAALQCLVEFAGLRGEPLKGLEPSKPKNQGKPQLRVTEAQKFIALAVAEGDPLALAAATMAVTGLRPGEVMALKARDCDDGGALLWVEKGKTAAARREVEVEEAFRPMLLAMVEGKASGDPLFSFVAVPRGRRPSGNVTKARTDALLRRVRALCDGAGVPEVVSHSLRGLNATLRKLGGEADTAVTRALGHTKIATTDRHYLAPGTREKVDGRRAHGRLLAGPSLVIG